MIFRLMGLLALVALIVFAIRYFRGYYSWGRDDNRLWSYKRKNFIHPEDLFDQPIESIPKSQIFMDLPPIEAALAAEFLNKHYIPLKSLGNSYGVLYGDNRTIKPTEFTMIGEPYEIVVGRGYGQLWQSLVDIPRHKYDATHILIGQSSFLDDRFIIELAELVQKE